MMVGAANALGVKYLARPDAVKVGILGSCLAIWRRILFFCVQ